MMTIRNSIRERLGRDELALGLSLRFARSVDAARIIMSCGYHWLFIDLEHSGMSLDMATQISVAALDAGIAPLVRVPAGQYAMATRALDGGALGIIMPHVDTPEQARELVAHLRYPPVGHRSLSAPLPQTGFVSMPPQPMMEAVDATTLVVAMLESPVAIGNAEAIAAVPGIDILLIGTNDLAAELGVPGRFDDPRVVAAYESVITACRNQNKWPAMGGIYEEGMLKRFVGLGMRMIQAGSDLGMMMQAATQRAAFLKNLG